MTEDIPVSPGQIAELMYRADAAPWDIDECQPVIRQLVALGAVRGDVLDPGCGIGWTALEAARTGCTVTGIDIAPTAIQRAQRNARNVGLAVNFEVGDATRLDSSTVSCYDTVVDSKLYDNLETAEDRQRFVTGLHRAMRPGARLYLYGFGPGHVNGVHNHYVDANNMVDIGIEEPDFETVLSAAGFDITYLGPTTYVLRGFERICSACPEQMPEGLVHIPVSEVHATRIGGI